MLAILYERSTNVSAEESEMKAFEFTFITSGFDPESENFEDTFFNAGCDDATLVFMKGCLAICFSREDRSFSKAVVSAYRDVLKTGARIERFEPDYLVSSNEIAARSGLTRQAISNYANGARGSSFPRPVTRIMSESPLWDWVEVSSWLYDNKKIDLDVVIDARISRHVNVFINAVNSHVGAAEKRLGAILQSNTGVPLAGAIV